PRTMFRHPGGCGGRGHGARATRYDSRESRATWERRAPARLRFLFFFPFPRREEEAAEKEPGWSPALPDEALQLSKRRCAAASSSTRSEAISARWQRRSAARSPASPCTYTAARAAASGVQS